MLCLIIFRAWPAPACAVQRQLAVLRRFASQAYANSLPSGATRLRVPPSAYALRSRARLDSADDSVDQTELECA